MLGGHLHVVKWLIKSGRAAFNVNAIVAAVETGQLDVLQWLRKRASFDPLTPGSFVKRYALCISSGEGGNLLSAAASSGRLEMVKWIVSEVDAWVGCQREYQASTHREGGVRHECCFHHRQCKCYVFDAASDGHLAVPHWLTAAQATHRWLELVGIPRRGRWRAASTTDVEVFRWAHTAFGRSLCASDLVDWGIRLAIASGRLDVLREIYRKEGAHPAWEGSIDLAAASGHRAIMEFLLERFFKCTASTMDAAATGNPIDIVRWLHEYRREGCSFAAMNGAAARGHFGVVVWLHYNRWEGCTTGAMDGAASSGNLNIVRWLHEHRTEGCTTKAMDEAVRVGALDVLIFLRSARSEGCSSLAFTAARIGRHVEIYQWLVSEFPGTNQGWSGPQTWGRQAMRRRLHAAT